ncbi:hypothetical protein [Oscillatoria sp. FACHB-1407]|uniref:hypothetical protein n=1 Tax=Oscillatoria sp. FACHB-1407 TaxID=2692847 RepID=UPI001F5561D6|nr:hypothetical protein [Oscillatoria sp. FACHB-1407]
MSKKTSSLESFLSVQTLVLVASAWAIFALLFFLLFSVPLPGQERPEWYGITTYILENLAFLGASILCFRNWRSPQIVSGRTVWLLIGLGMLSYFVGNLVLGYWELGLGKEPDVTPGDFFFLLTYVLLGWGMLLAVLSRQLTLTPPQWVIVFGILIGSVALAYFLVLKPSQASLAESVTLPSLEQPAFAQAPPADPPASPQVAPAAPPVAPEAPVEAAPAEVAPAEEPSTAPGWAIAIEEFLAPFASVVLLFYLVGDISLVVMATTLLLAFWGGRFSLSWRFIAAAALCFYIADLWFFYAVYNIEDYQTGALPEVFFIFSACLFAIGAALEYDLSTRSRRTSRRRG